MKNFSLRALSIAAITLSGIAVYFPNVIAISPVAAQETKRGHGQDFLQQLNLTPEQTTAIKALKEQNKPNRESTMQRTKQLQQELQTLLAGSAPAFQVTAKFDEIQALHQQSTRSHFEQTLKIREILTPAQRQKFSELMQSKRKMWQGRMKDRMQSPTPNS